MEQILNHIYTIWNNIIIVLTMEDENNGLIILGTAYTPQYEDDNNKDDQTTLFKHNQIDNNFANSCKNLNVHIEHDDGIKIGTVIDAYVNEKRQLKTLLHIDNSNKFVNELLPPKLNLDPKTNKRFYNGLSLGNDISFTKRDDKVSVNSNKPVEVSIVMNGDRPDTFIDDYWYVPKSMSPEEFIQKELSNKIQRFH